MLLVDEPTYTTLETVPFDQRENIEDRENSPPPLIIDTNKGTCSSQSIMSNYFPRTEPIGERLPSGARNAVDKTHNYVRSNQARPTTNENSSVWTDRSNKRTFSRKKSVSSYYIHRN